MSDESRFARTYGLKFRSPQSAEEDLYYRGEKLALSGVEKQTLPNF